MDSHRINTQIRSLTASPSRRGVSRVLGGLAVGGVLGRIGRAEVEARKKGKRGKKKCNKNPCAGQPNDTPCNGTGRCFQFACVGRPVCDPPGATCSPGNAVSDICCSRACLNTNPAPGICGTSFGGRACLQSSDCAADHTCVGYRCVEFY